MLQAMLGYLYANWAHSGLLVAFYATVILLCNVSTIPFFIFLVWMQFPVYLMHEFEEHVYPGNFQFFLTEMFSKVQTLLFLLIRNEFFGLTFLQCGFYYLGQLFLPNLLTLHLEYYHLFLAFLMLQVIF